MGLGTRLLLGGLMPQPITPTGQRGVPRQRRTSSPSPRQLNEQSWRTLVGTYRLISRLKVEKLKHHLADDADTLARSETAVEEELEYAHPFRWARHRPHLLREQAEWWAEPHDDDVLTCTACQLQLGGMPERIDVPWPPQDSR
jgi:hypothetical protein